MRNPSALLVIDPDPEIPGEIGDTLQEFELRILSAHSVEEGESILGETEISVIFCDLGLDPSQGFSFLKRTRKTTPHLPIVATSASAESRIAIEAVKNGAFDFLAKPLVASEVRRSITDALNCARKANEPVEIDPRNENEDQHDTLVGNSRAMLDVYKALGRLSPTPVTVLIRGETGTGKELIARALFQYGHRSHQPFITINCAAIPDNLLESELFGHEKGSFTGAVNRRIGKFEQANGATLFLDEIGDLNHALQAKLLRVLQEKRFQRVGGTEEISVDVRIIAATHRNLEKMIAEGEFREDLFYRLNVATIKLPPLRDRTGDISLLCGFFLRRFSEELGLPPVSMTREAIARLESAQLPGNIRQLQNMIRKALLRSRGYSIDRDMIEDLLVETEPPDTGNSGTETFSQYCEDLVRQAEAGSLESIHTVAVEKLESELLRLALQKTGGNISKTAQWVGLSRLTVREKGRKYGLLP
jgi:DNA-binding NtrC family response regulator